MAYERHRTGARGEALAIAWLITREWSVFKCFQAQSPCDLVCIKMRGAARAEVILLEVRYGGPNSRRCEGLTLAQHRAGVKLMVVHHDGQVEIEPEWSKTMFKKDRSATARRKPEE